MSENGQRPDSTPDEPVFTTLAVGEEGDPEPDPGMAFLPPLIQPPRWEAVSTKAVGEEGGPSRPGEPEPAAVAPGEQGGDDLHPAPTTAAIGEAGEASPTPPLSVTTLALGEEGGPPLNVTTLALGEEGDGGWASAPGPAESPAEGTSSTPATGEMGGEGVFTTLAIGEEGDGGFGVELPIEPAVCEGGDPGGQMTTLAIGEEGDGGLFAGGDIAAPGPAGRPWGEAVASTMALGEEGAPIFGSWDS